jgi:hypothetical protein
LNDLPESDFNTIYDLGRADLRNEIRASIMSLLDLPWLHLVDNKDGTATLSGTPPVGTTGSFTFSLGPYAVGSFQIFEPFTVEVVSGPVFTNPNSATFTVGAAYVFDIAASVGTIDLVGELPQGLSFTGGTSARISGTPAAGTGGQYQLTLTDDAGEFGSTTQALLLNILEAPKITNAPSANVRRRRAGLVRGDCHRLPEPLLGAVGTGPPAAEGSSRRDRDVLHGDGASSKPDGQPSQPGGLRDGNADDPGLPDGC